MGLIGLGLANVVWVAVWHFAYPKERNVAVTAETQFAEIVFTGLEQTWSLQGARKCPSDDSDCSDNAPFMPQEMVWGDCDHGYVLRSAAVGGVLVVRVEGQEGWQSAFLSDEDFARNGVQPFAGYARAGTLPTSGGPSLISGTYAFYERDAFSALTRRGLDESRRGELRNGDVVEVVDTTGGRIAPARKCTGLGNEPEAGDRVAIRGHLALSADPDSPTLTLSYASGGGSTALVVRRSGLHEPLVIEPDFVDLVVSSPSFLAISLILAYFAALLQPFLADGRKRRRRVRPQTRR